MFDGEILAKFHESFFEMGFFGQVQFLFWVGIKVIEFLAVRPFCVTPVLITQCVAELWAACDDCVSKFLFTGSFRMPKQWPKRCAL